jgi:hypothetical protein
MSTRQRNCDMTVHGYPEEGVS